MGQIERIREFLAENFYAGTDVSQLGENDSLLEMGIVDSTGVLDLVAFVEESFGISVADREITPENFDSIRRLADFIKGKQQMKASCLTDCEKRLESE
jgi:acyl carrier protein